MAAVNVVRPVPPLATAKVPARVMAPVVALFGVSPVVPAENDVTPPVEAAHVGTPLEIVRTYPFVPAARRDQVFVADP